MARLAGIDIDDSLSPGGPAVGKSPCVRVAVVRSSYRRVVVEQLIEVPIGETAVRVGAPDDLGSVASAVRTAMRDVRPDAVAVALAGDRCFYRRVQLPATADRELESVLGFELESSIPFEMEGAVYDKRILSHGPPTSIVLLAAIARIEDVRERIELVKSATGREPDVVDAGSLALANLCSLIPELTPRSAVGESAPIAVLDLGEARAELLVLDRGEAVFARTLSHGTFDGPAVPRELKQSLTAFRALGGAAPSALFLAGPGVHVARAEEVLSAAIGLPVYRLPLQRAGSEAGGTPALVLEGAPQALLTDSRGNPCEPHERLPVFAKAIALAIGAGSRSRSLNLRQGPLEATRSFAFLREKLPLLAGLSSVIFVSFAFSVVAELRGLSTERLLLDQQLKATTLEVLGEETSDLGRAQELLDKGPAAEEDPMPRADAFDVMVQLSKAVPENVVHDVAELDFARGHATIQGLVPTGQNAQETADKIATGMKDHPCMKDVKVQRTSQFGAEKQRYILELDVRCEEKKDPKKKAESDKPKKEGSE